MIDHPIRFATFLAPNMLPVYQFITAYVGRKLGCTTELIVGSSFDQFAAGQADVGFICGLPYVQLADQNPPPIELLAAPVLEGERYQNRPIYFSDVIVRRETASHPSASSPLVSLSPASSSPPYQTFADLRGCVWAYNDLDSQSGYGITRHRLVEMGETRGFFGRVVEAGSHQNSIRLVCTGEIDAAAIDSQVLAIELRDHPELAAQLRVIDVLGPSPIQPVVAASRLPAPLKADLQTVLLEMGEEAAARSRLAHGFVDHFAPVTDADYNPIREMLKAAESVGFMILR